MANLSDGEIFEMKGSGKKPYVLRNIGGVYDCSCPAWRNQSHPIDVRTCKHLVKHLGIDSEVERVGYDAMPTAAKKKLSKKSGEPAGNSTKRPKKEPAPKEVPNVLLAHSWDNEQDVTGWWISEKLDGVRAYWDGKKFLSRAGNVFHAPDYFTKGLPPYPLDGELWMGRKMFEKTSGIVRRKNGGDLWKKIKYRVFDVPEHGGVFEDRVDATVESTRDAPYATHVGQGKCAGVDHLRNALERGDKAGCEGLMLREPGSLYETKRSTTLLKVKTFYDAEAVVIGYNKGKGRHKGRCGSLRVRAILCEDESIPAPAVGTEFKAGTGLSDDQRKNPPEIGAVITYRFQELTKKGVPRFPSFVCVRHDVEVKQR
jgi:DNA ligase-1